MAAFNWIRFEARCPACGEQARMRAQCHVASSYQGDATGRFRDRDYELSERMRWWPREDPRYPQWQEQTQDDPVRDRSAECCDVPCPGCGAALFAVIGFESVTPVSIDQVGLEADWPATFPR